MNSSQRRRRAQIHQLIEICWKHGITSTDLRSPVHNRVTYGYPREGQRYEDFARRADRINRAGLMAQLYYLQGIMGNRLLTQWLEDQGSVLDGFVKGFSSSAEAREADVGRHNVDNDGTVLID